MPAKVIDADSVTAKFISLLETQMQGVDTQLGLATILTNDNPHSVRYQKLLGKDCRKFGINYQPFLGTTDFTLKSCIDQCNGDPDIHGILLFHPLNQDIKTDRYVLTTRIKYEKDVEGLHQTHAGRLFQQYHEDLIVPCTAKAIFEALRYHQYPFEGNAVILNRSDVVGKPLQQILEHLGMTVSVAYVKTTEEDRRHMLSNADLVVTAVPNQDYVLPSDALKQGTTVIAVNPTNIDEDALRERCGLITSKSQPIGRITRKMTLHNLYLLYKTYQLPSAF